MVFWVILCLSIAVAALLSATCYAVWLAHKTSDVWSEVNVLVDVVGRLGDLASNIKVPPAPGGQDRAGDVIVVDGIRYSAGVDVV